VVGAACCGVGSRGCAPRTAAEAPPDPAGESRWRARALPQATGASILAELQRQRESIQRSQQAQQRIAGSAAESGGILRRMSKWWRP
jgi:hypothetical protein